MRIYACHQQREAGSVHCFERVQNVVYFAAYTRNNVIPTPRGAPDRTTKAVELKLVQQHVALVVRDMLKTAVERQCQYTMGQFRSTATNDADWSSNGGAAKSARSSVRECR